MSVRIVQKGNNKRKDKRKTERAASKQSKRTKKETKKFTKSLNEIENDYERFTVKWKRYYDELPKKTRKYIRMLALGAFVFITVVFLVFYFGDK